jgi:hypothetical protein
MVRTVMPVRWASWSMVSTSSSAVMRGSLRGSLTYVTVVL